MDRTQKLTFKIINKLGLFFETNMIHLISISGILGFFFWLVSLFNLKHKKCQYMNSEYITTVQGEYITTESLRRLLGVAFFLSEKCSIILCTSKKNRWMIFEIRISFGVFLSNVITYCPYEISEFNWFLSHRLITI